MRCIRTVEALRERGGSDLESLVVFTEIERDAAFVREADIAVPVSAAQGHEAAAYLDADLLLKVFLGNGADAVWPGWGFLAEDADFAARTTAVGLVFVGPPASVMRRLADKLSAKAIARSASVPVIPWSGRPVKNPAEARLSAGRLGYPLMVKAVTGGGGRGIRRVDSPAELGDALERAKTEARAAFGDAHVFLEQRIAGGRHIEVQVAGDFHGNIVALGLRECSVQRRHQKVIEEAPPPGLSQQVSNSISAAAVRLAAKAGYVGLGTVEFLLRGESFFFLEMNPRLQVEHAITECVVKLDLVELQIRIARHESIAGLRFRQQGYAIEARVCAEEPSEGFLPTSGRIALFEPPLGAGVRVDTDARAGSEVPAAFDSLIAKVVGFGESRQEARSRLVSALRRFEMVIDGGATNRGFLVDVLDSRDFQDGEVDTEWLARWLATRGEEPRFQAEALLAASILTYESGRSRAIGSLVMRSGGVRLAEVLLPRPRDIVLIQGGIRNRTQTWAIGESQYRVRAGERLVFAEFRRDGPRTATLRTGAKRVRVLYQVSPTGVRVELDGVSHRFAFRGEGHVTASTHAMVVALDCEEGDLVAAGQTLAVLEAMKVEIALRAPIAGVVSEIRVRKGQTVEPEQLLVLIEPESDAAEREISTPIALPESPDPLVDFGSFTPASAENPGLELVAAVAGEVRSATLGFDVDGGRAERVVDVLQTVLDRRPSESVRRKLAELGRLLTMFADVQELFQRAPRLRADGAVAPSNHARLLSYLRSRGTDGEPRSASFHRLVDRALAHYGVSPDGPADRQDVALVRILASQYSSEAREKMIRAVLRCIRRQAREGLDFSEDSALDYALARLGSLRGGVSDRLADEALAARGEIFDGGRVKQETERLRKRVDHWLTSDRGARRVPSVELLEETASAPRPAFHAVSRGLCDVDRQRVTWALAARLYRNHAPSETLVGIDHLDAAGLALGLVFASGTRVAAAVSPGANLGEAARSLLEAALRRESSADWALEIFVPEERAHHEGRLRELQAWLVASGAGPRITICFGSDGDAEEYVTYCMTPDHGVAALPLYGLHPAVAERIDLAALSAFELTRLPGGDDIYGFCAHDPTDPFDERVLVLAEVRGGSRPRHDARINRAFERTFLEATVRLGSWLSARPTGRGMGAHRMSFFVAGAPDPHPSVIGRLARRLMPTTRALGVDTLKVRLQPRPTGGGRPVQPCEIVVADAAGREILLRETEAEGGGAVGLKPTAPDVIRARRRGLMHPHDLVRFLTSGHAPRTMPSADPSERLPRASFEEWDLAPDVDGRPTARRGSCGADRRSSVVFGIVSTPTPMIPEGMRRVLVVSDPSIEMGALGPDECERIVAAIDLAERLSVPVEWIPVSSGARISMDSGTENLDATARVARRIVTFTQAGGVIHIIVNGLNVGAQSYFDALATMLMHTRGALIMTPRGAMVLTGKAALEASGGVAGADEFAMGGFEGVMGPSGQAHYSAWNLVDAYRILYEHYRYTYVVPGERSPRECTSNDSSQRLVTLADYGVDDDLGFRSVGEIFDDEHNPGRKRQFSMRALMSAVVDADGGHLERWRLWDGAETAIVWDARLGGIPMSLIGIESHGIRRSGARPVDGPEEWTGGTLFPRSSKKIARALSAASGNRPVVILANLAGFDGSPESMRELQLECGAEIIRAVVNFQGPIVFVVVSRYHGGAYVVFSRALNPDLRAVALEGSYASVIGGSAAAAVVFAKEVRRRTEEDPAVIRAREAVRGPKDDAGRTELERVREVVYAEKQRGIAQEFDSIHTIERARSVGSLEYVVPGESLRPFVIQLLRSSASVEK